MSGQEAMNEFDPLSLAFASMLARQGADRLTLALARLVAAASASGHSCLSLGELAERLAGDKSLPPQAEWRDAVLCARGGQRFVTDDPATPAPLLLDGGRLYLYRYWQAEQRVAAAIRGRLAAAPNYGGWDGLKDYFRKLFPSPASAWPAAGGLTKAQPKKGAAAGKKGREGGQASLFDFSPAANDLPKEVEAGMAEPDWQAVAAASCLFHNFAIVSGGPGTGKTTTALRILSLLLERDPGLRIKIAAPTGKAAARLTEAMRRRVGGTPTHEAAHSLEAQTIHRLLAFHPGAGGFRVNAENKLAADVLLVDEASMIGLLLMDSLLDALPGRCRLILLGDHRQLESVETGFVLGDICEAAGHGADASLHAKSASFASAFQKLSGQGLAGGGKSRLGDAVTQLRRNHRFASQPGIAGLAQAVRDSFEAGQPAVEQALALLRGGAQPDLAWGADGDVAKRFVRAWISDLEGIKANGMAGALAALAAINRRRILCPVREGEFGVAGLNLLAEIELERLRGIPCGGNYQGRPVLVTGNNYALNLFNGDVGVVWPDDDGGLAAWFAGVSSGAAKAAATAGAGVDAPPLRKLPLSRLPDLQTAWAMTIHRSQGSEYEEVLLVFKSDRAGKADNDAGSFLSPELFYTGATRASRRLVVLGEAEAIGQAIASQTVRHSGLKENLEKNLRGQDS